MTDQTHNDLGWRAFRYVAAEMSPDEVARFEEQLADDQASREAVARAVELADALAVVSAERDVSTDLVTPTLHRPDRSFWWSRMGWIGVGAAAALACVFLFRAIRGEPEPNLAANDAPRAPAEFVSSDDPEATRLAQLWCRTRDELEPADDSSWSPPEPFDPLSLEPDGITRAGAGEAPDRADIIGSDDDLPGDTADTVEAVPSWMLAALAGEADGIDDGLPEPEEP
jgi:hypothetical protein